MRPVALARSVLAGTAGTAALTLSYALERRLRRDTSGPLDYDDSIVPGRIVVSDLHLPHVSAKAVAVTDDGLRSKTPRAAKHSPLDH
jgi:hypothetical protein